MSSVSAVTISVSIHLIPGNRPVVNEIVAMDVIDITIIIIIDTVACNLVRICPHIISQVRMGIFHSFIHDCDNNRRISTSQLAPDILYIDVSAFLHARSD